MRTVFLFQIVDSAMKKHCISLWWQANKKQFYTFVIPGSDMVLALSMNIAVPFKQWN